MERHEIEVPRTLLVSNAFPPKVGGIQTFMEGLFRSFPPAQVAVLAPRWTGSDDYDAGAAFTVVRDRDRFMWPGPNLRRKVHDLVGEFGAEVVLFGDAFPLAALGPELARRGTPYLVMAHGFDYWMSAMPGSNAWLRRATRSASRVPVCSAFIGKTVRTAVPSHVPVSVLTPGVDVRRFHPDLPTDDIRGTLGIGDRPLVVCVSRLVARKGQDVLIRAMRRVRRHVPDAALLIVGAGSAEGRLRRLAQAAPPRSVFFAGEVPAAELPRYYAVGDVFAMPCRNRVGGFEVEGWGIVFVEAAACGQPVVVGDSGGARETLVDGETGFLVDGDDVAEVGDAVGRILRDPELRERMGKAGRAWVEAEHTEERSAEQLAAWLREAAS
ncbi:MAG: glycosyltransferase family 4 protein [Actinomycetota bacterium]